MEITVKNMSRKSDGCVTRVELKAVLEQDGYKATSSYDLGIPMKDPSDPNFVAYEDLTEDIVKGWFTADPLLLLPLEEELQKMIDEKKNPSHVIGKPW